MEGYLFLVFLLMLAFGTIFICLLVLDRIKANQETILLKLEDNFRLQTKTLTRLGKELKEKQNGTNKNT